jgi:carboxypeptidase Taq
MLRPHLERLVALKREASEHLGGAHPYDPLLDEYEPGMTVKELDPLLGALAAPLKDLARRAKGRGRPCAALEAPYRDEAALDRVVHRLAADMGFDHACGVIARSAHPFSTGFHPTDCRFTVRAEGDGLMNQLLSALHECGHSLYEQGMDPRWWGTTLSRHASLGMHEAMSRLWENMVGRDPAFWRRQWPHLRRAFPRLLAKVSVEDVLEHLLYAPPSPVRLKAGEVSYSLHILLRYELEKELILGRLKVRDIPEAWNAKSAELLGAPPPDDRRGCLQDIHWSGGSFGYFPTYALGNLYAAQFLEAMRRDLPEMDARVAEGDLAPIKAWLNEHIHIHGRRWYAQDLCRRVTGAPLSAEPLMRHLRARCGEVYGV